jgi:hypothetical protein
MLPLALLAMSSTSPALAAMEEHYLAGQFLLTWDDKIDGSTEGSEKRVVLQLQVKGNEVFGEIIGPIDGQRENAIIVGRIDGGDNAVKLFTFRQIETGYTCTYQVTVGRGAFKGEWRDIYGRCGDVKLESARSLLGNEGKKH